MNDKKRPLQPGSGAEPIPSFLHLSEVVEVTGLTFETRAAKAGFIQLLAQVSRSAGCGAARRRCSIVPGSPRPSLVRRRHANAKENRGFPTHFPRGSAPRFSSGKPIGDQHEEQRTRWSADGIAASGHLVRQRTESPRKSTNVPSDETSRRSVAIDRRSRSMTTSTSSTQVTSELNERNWRSPLGKFERFAA